MAETEKVRRPGLLPSGGTIGIINPSSPCDPELLELGRDELHKRGFRTVLAPHVLDGFGHRAGADKDRAEDLMAFYADPSVHVLWCARGGFSSCRLWPFLDWERLSKLPPKMVVGYSDTTSLLIPLSQKVGVVALHGPLVFELGTQTAWSVLDWALRVLQSPVALGAVPGLAAETLVTGVAEGALCGGCLSLVAATVGTAYQIETAGKLLLLEDINESPPRVERYLMQLRESGLLKSASGFVIGEATAAEDAETLPMRFLWAEALEPWGKPTVLGYPFGHVQENYALPLGVRARLDATAGTLSLLEPAVQ